jgi:hypothetical protein
MCKFVQFGSVETELLPILENAKRLNLAFAGPAFLLWQPSNRKGMSLGSSTLRQKRASLKIGFLVGRKNVLLPQTVRVRITTQ